MTISLLSIRDFKCFSKADVVLAPFTLLTGFNAGGKSTTLQSLLLLAQGLRASPESRYLPLNGSLVRLGTAGEVVRHGGRKEVRFAAEGFGGSASWRLAVPARGDDGKDDQRDWPRSVRRESLMVVEVHCDGSSVMPGQLAPPASPLHSAIRDLVFLGATRHGRQDIFPSPDDAEPVRADVGSEGQFAPWWYVNTADDVVPPNRRCPGDTGVNVRSQVDAWLHHLFPGAAANAEAIGDTGFARLEFRIGRTSGWARPSNVGYGLSYAFPLIVALLTARVGQVVIVDSPEAHLHPRAQSRMGTMLATFAAAGVQLLVESHSDHVLSGARLAVRKGVLDSAALAVHFFSRDFTDNENGIISPSVFADGRLSDWPEGFFDQADIDLATLAELSE